MTMNRKGVSLLILIILVRIVCAWNSEGFYQFDEHFQIVEFIGKLQGVTPEQNLPWEYHQKIRPWFQPFMFFGISKLFMGFDPLISPHTQVFLFRLLSGFLGLGSSAFLIFAAVRTGQIKGASDSSRIFWGLGLSTLLWFFPFFQVRPSAESWASSWFWFGVATSFFATDDLSKAKKRGIYALTGMFFGLAFISKYQAGLLILGWGLVTIAPRVRVSVPQFFERLQWVLLSVVFVLMMIGVGAVFDQMGYGIWQNTAWNYFDTNLLRGVAFRFSAQPWWFYIKEALIWAPPLTTVIFLTSILGGFGTKDLRISVPILLYLAFHFWMSNKELRFLFPVLPGVVLLMLNSEWTWRIFEGRKPLWRTLRTLLVVENLILLAAVCGLPASSAMPTYRAIYAAATERDTLFTLNDRPYGLLDLEVKFYQPSGLKVLQLNDWSEVERVAAPLKQFLVLSSGWEDLQGHVAFKRFQCSPVYQSHPEWLRSIQFGNWQARSRIRKLFRCRQTGED